MAENIGFYKDFLKRNLHTACSHWREHSRISHPRSCTDSGSFGATKHHTMHAGELSLAEGFLVCFKTELSRSMLTHIMRGFQQLSSPAHAGRQPWPELARRTGLQSGCPWVAWASPWCKGRSQCMCCRKRWPLHPCSLRARRLYFSRRS